MGLLWAGRACKGEMGVAVHPKQLRGAANTVVVMDPLLSITEKSDAK